MNPTGNAEEDDLFKHPYIDLLWFLQKAIVNDLSTLNGYDFILDDFCYKPISGEGCLVESPMQYFKSNKTYMDSKDNA